MFPWRPYAAAVSVGVTALAAFNTWITAVPLFTARLAGSPFEHTFEALVSAVFNWTNLGAQVLVLVSTTASTPSFPRFLNSPMRRLKAGLALHFGVFNATLLLVHADYLSPEIFFAVILWCVAMSAIAAALMMSVYAVLSGAPPILSQAVSSGNGIAGFVVSLGALIVVLGSEKTFHVFDKQSDSIMIAFSSAISVITYMSLPWLPTDHTEDENFDYVPVDQIDENDIIDEEIDSLIPVQLIFGRIAKHASAIFINFAITLFVFPALTVSVKPISTNIKSTDVFTGTMFVAFNLGDCLGKLLPGFPGCQTDNANFLLYFAIARAMFVPILMVCNVPKPSLLPVLIGDYGFIWVVFLMGISNGWVGSDVLMVGPSAAGADTDEDRPRTEMQQQQARRVAADALVVSLTLGLAAGGAASVLMV